MIYKKERTRSLVAHKKLTLISELQYIAETLRIQGYTADTKKRYMY